MPEACCSNARITGVVSLVLSSKLSCIYTSRSQLVADAMTQLIETDICRCNIPQSSVSTPATDVDCAFIHLQVTAQQYVHNAE